jgi:hypothetical protein
MPKAPKVTPGAQAQSAHLQGRPPSSNPAASRELDWTGRELVQKVGIHQREKEKKKTSTEKKQAIIGIGCPRSPHLTLQSAVCSLQP